MKSFSVIYLVLLTTTYMMIRHGHWGIKLPNRYSLSSKCDKRYPPLFPDSAVTEAAHSPSLCACFIAILGPGTFVICLNGCNIIQLPVYFFFLVLIAVREKKSSISLVLLLLLHLQSSLRDQMLSKEEIWD